MKIFLLFLLTIVVAAAAPHVPSASDNCKLQHFLLAEILEHVKVLEGQDVNKSSWTYVENVITPEHCTLENFCKAGEVLSAYKAEELGLNDKDWLLPRSLVAYTRNTHCNVSSSLDRVEFPQFLENIKLCCQKEYRKTCNQKKHPIA
ncbi:hypothetical protein AMELA_G00155960 [Ameiurus melas]|uniref:Interleukin n=1 Tax=Ameiurus melas TaxID=219545 RepID=A0A7J6ADY5_AMEME|nr:hypothetical protein AMELA_G00155960 [Ameiurus melas]